MHKKWKEIAIIIQAILLSISQPVYKTFERKAIAKAEAKAELIAKEKLDHAENMI